MTQKGAEILLFEQVVELLSAGSHLTVNGLQEIVNINASMNLGSSDIVKSNFSKINPVERAIIQTTNIPDPNCVSGWLLVDEGHFDDELEREKIKLGYWGFLKIGRGKVWN